MKTLVVTFAITLVIIVIISVQLFRLAPVLRAVVYDALVERELRSLTAATSEWKSIKSSHIEVRYESDPDIAEIVLDTAEQHFTKVAADFGYEPEGPVLVVVYQTREALREEFGWSASDDASGVYWGGAVRVLSPRAYVDESACADKSGAYADTRYANASDLETIARRFESEGPLVHEFTHYVLDHVAHGNYPRWLSEGLAQYEEYTLTGYLWADPEQDGKAPFYPYEELDKKFFGLEDQARAYRQAFLLTYYLVSEYGWDTMLSTVSELSRGTSFHTVLHKVYGLDGARLESEWDAWLKNTAVPPYYTPGGTKSSIAE